MYTGAELKESSSSSAASKHWFSAVLLSGNRMWFQWSPLGLATEETIGAAGPRMIEAWILETQ
jgi:hypothetical protein